MRPGRHPQGREALVELVGRDRQHDAAVVEQVADRLHLRQDEAALGRLDVLRHDEQDDVPLADEPGGDALFFVVLGQLADDRLDHVLDAGALLCGDDDGEEGERVMDRPGDLGDVAEQIGLVDDGDDRRAAFLQRPDPVGLQRDVRLAEDDDRHVGLFERVARAPDAQRAELPLVVEAGGVDQHAGPDAVDLHRLVDGVGRRARDLGGEGGVLVGDRVDKGGFAAVALAEDADVQPVGAGGCCQAHGMALLLYDAVSCPSPAPLTGADGPVRTENRACPRRCPPGAPR